MQVAWCDQYDHACLACRFVHRGLGVRIVRDRIRDRDDRRAGFVVLHCEAVLRVAGLRDHLRRCVFQIRRTVFGDWGAGEVEQACVRPRGRAAHRFPEFRQQPVRLHPGQTGILRRQAGRLSEDLRGS